MNGAVCPKWREVFDLCAGVCINGVGINLTESSAPFSLKICDFLKFPPFRPPKSGKLDTGIPFTTGRPSAPVVR